MTQATPTVNVKHVARAIALTDLRVAAYGVIYGRGILAALQHMPPGPYSALIVGHALFSLQNFVPGDQITWALFIAGLALIAAGTAIGARQQHPEMATPA